SPTYGAVTVLIVDKPREKRFYLLCFATPLQATRLLRLWSHRHWIEQVFRTLKHLLATEACQVHSEDAYYGHLVLPDFDTNRYILTGVRGRGSLNCKALWISCLDTWPKILDTYMAKIDLKCPQLLLYFYV